MEGSHRESRRPPLVTATDLLFYLVAYVLDGIAYLPTRLAESLFDLTGCLVRDAFVAESVIVREITNTLFDTTLECIGFTVEFIFVHVTASV